MRAFKFGDFWRSVRGWIPGIVISGLALWLVLSRITWSDVGNALKAMSLTSLGLAVLAYLGGLTFRALCWHTLLQRKVSFKRAFFVLSEGYLLNNLFPLRLGEVGRAVILGRNSGLGILPVFSSIVVERAYDLAIAASLLLGTLPLVLQMAWARPMAITILTLAVLALVGLFWAARYRQKAHSFLAALGSRWRFFMTWVLPKIESLLEGFSVLTRPRFFIESLGFMLISWALAIFQDYILLRNVAPQAPLWWMAFVLGAVALGAAVPSVAAALGVFEAAAVGALSLLGVDPAPALAFAIVVHLLQFIVPTIIGVIGLAQEGQTLSVLYRDLVSRKR